MNEKKAKLLRKQIYKTEDYRKREYVRHRKTGVIYATGNRRKYQEAKKEYYASKRIV